MSEIVLVARVSHETNTFVGDKTGRTDFKDQLEIYGDEIPSELKGTNTEIGGVIDAAVVEDIDLRYVLVAEAEPHGLVTGSAFEYYRDYITEAAREQSDAVDGVFLSFHGAMVAEGNDDAEGEMLSAVRSVVGEETPIVTTVDPHANISRKMINQTDAIVAYETTPHIDMAETGKTGFEVLAKTMRKEISPAMDFERIPVIPSSIKVSSQEPPLAELIGRANQLEQTENVIKVNVCPGYRLADIPDMGFTIVSVVDSQKNLATRTSREMSELVWDLRSDFVEEAESAAAAISQATSSVKSSQEDIPIVVAEMHDNPGGGNPADGTLVLRELLNQEVTNAGLAIICDPEAVAKCVSSGVGQSLSLDIGGKSENTDVYGSPLEVDGYVKAITDGRFVNTGPRKTGVENKLGRTVRLRCGKDNQFEIILTENRVQPADLEIWRHIGIQPERLNVIVVKSVVHYRADYGSIASEFISVDESPSREYNRIKRPKFPIDSMKEDDYPYWK